MIDLFIVILICTALAFVVDSRSHGYESVEQTISRDGQSKFVYYLILVIVILFSGLRTTYNDTTTYMYGFTLIPVNDLRLTTIFEAYGGFTLYQQLIKRFVSDDPQALIVISAVILNVLFIAFIKRHSATFGASIFLYLIGNYVFGMAGLKQALAMAVSLYAIENMMENKYVKAGLWLLLAMTFHPYIICIAVLPFLRRAPWSKSTILIIFSAIVMIANIENLLSIISSFGKDYTIEELTSNSVNPFRVLVETIPVVIAFTYRKRIAAENDQWLNLGVNMRILSFTFIAAGLFVNPIYFARIGTYFSVLNAISIPIMLLIAFGRTRDGLVLRLGYYGIFAFYFLLDITKLGSISIFQDIFHHISVFNLL